ncbi:MAG: hypothetical protein VX231_08405 [Pseudomonadota bacterium]|nr:hypothetical protein [Pseudomonadota bacterium]
MTNLFRLSVTCLMLFSVYSRADCAYYLVTNIPNFQHFACLDVDNDTKRNVEVGITFNFIDYARNPSCNGGSSLTDQQIVSRMSYCVDKLNPTDPYNPNTALMQTIDLQTCPDINCFMVYPPQDNCPNISNYNQSDIDGDNIGDVCDSDIDGDTVSNDIEIAYGGDPNDPSDGGNIKASVISASSGINKQVPAMGGIGFLALGLSMLGLGAVRLRK